jgi:hypothetical protein
VEKVGAKLEDFINEMIDQPFARMLYPTRTVDESVQFDIVERRDRTGDGARIVAKGTVPKRTGMIASEMPHVMHQFMDSFSVNEKDLKREKGLKDDLVKICLDNLQRLENDVAINGDAEFGIPGIATMATANPNGTVTAQGTWDGSGSTRDLYNDCLGARAKMSGKFRPVFLLGCNIDTNWLRAPQDDTRRPYWKDVASLFGKTEMDNPNTWLIEVDTDVLAPGYVYMITKNPKAAEMVISEDRQLRPIPLQPGGNYPVELFSWETFEEHDNTGFVKIKVTE